MKTCTYNGCKLSYLAMGYCNAHYLRSKNNKPMDTPINSTLDVGASLKIRLNNRINKNGSVPIFNPSLGRCWIWEGNIRKGRVNYGTISIKQEDRTNKRLQAHRVVYSYFVGEIPFGLELDHLCRIHQCVNPKHLEPVTTKINQHRGYGWAGKNHRKTHCPQGHPYDDKHTYRVKDYGRRCRTCNNMSARLYRKRKKERRNV